MSRQVSQQYETPDLNLIKELWNHIPLSQLDIHLKKLSTETTIQEKLIELLLFNSLKNPDRPLFNFNYGLQDMDKKIQQWRKGEE